MIVKKFDKRKLSGGRLLARCEVVAKTDDPFSPWNGAKSGHVVLNIRGGCLYLGEYFDEHNISKLFPNNGIGTFFKFTLYSENGPDVVLENIKVCFQRFKREADRDGVVFSFVDITERQLDILFGLNSSLPVIGQSEEASVPNDDIFSLDRTQPVEYCQKARNGELRRWN